MRGEVNSSLALPCEIPLSATSFLVFFPQVGPNEASTIQIRCPFPSFTKASGHNAPPRGVITTSVDKQYDCNKRNQGKAAYSFH